MNLFRFGKPAIVSTFGGRTFAQVVPLPRPPAPALTAEPVRGNFIQRQRRLLPEAKAIAVRRITPPPPAPVRVNLPIIPAVRARSVASPPVPISAIKERNIRNLLVDINRTPTPITNLLVDINRGSVPIIPLTKPTIENALDEEVPPGEPGGDPETDLLRTISREGSRVLGGDPSRTISSQLGQRQIEGRAGIVTNTICAGLNAIDRNHCVRSFRSEQTRVQAATVQNGAPVRSGNFIGWTPAYGRRIASGIRRGRISCR